MKLPELAGPSQWMHEPWLEAVRMSTRSATPGGAVLPSQNSATRNKVCTLSQSPWPYPGKVMPYFSRSFYTKELKNWNEMKLFNANFQFWEDHILEAVCDVESALTIPFVFILFKDLVEGLSPCWWIHNFETAKFNLVS